MRILVYGAGNIGQLYAARLAEAGHEVRILARGRRLRQIRDAGIRLEDFRTGRRVTTHADAIERLEPAELYDLILVVLPKHCVDDVLPILAENQTPNVVFFGNNATGGNSLNEALGRQRVLLGFPGAAAIEKDDYLEFVILSAREQPTTIGELDGAQSARINEIAAVLRSAGFPVSVCSNMDAWLKTHAVEMVSTASALHVSGNDVERLRRSREAMRLMVQAIREGYRVLTALGIPLTPASRRVLRWIPEPLLIALMKLKFASRTMAVKVGHAADARAEMRILAAEVARLAEQVDVPTPSLDALQQQVKAPAMCYSPRCSRTAPEN